MFLADVISFKWHGMVYRETSLLILIVAFPCVLLLRYTYYYFVSSIETLLVTCMLTTSDFRKTSL